MKNINQYTKQKLVEMYSALRKLNTQILRANKKLSTRLQKTETAIVEFDKLVLFLEETMSFPEYPRNIEKLNEYRKMVDRLKPLEGGDANN